MFLLTKDSPDDTEASMWGALGVFYLHYGMLCPSQRSIPDTGHRVLGPGVMNAVTEVGLALGLWTMTGTIWSSALGYPAWGTLEAVEAFFWARAVETGSYSVALEGTEFSIWPPTWPSAFHKLALPQWLVLKLTKTGKGLLLGLSRNRWPSCAN